MIYYSRDIFTMRKENRERETGGGGGGGWGWEIHWAWLERGDSEIGILERGGGLLSVFGMK